MQKLIDSKEGIQKLDLTRYVASGLKIKITDLSGNIIVDFTTEVAINEKGDIEKPINELTCNILDVIDSELRRKLTHLKYNIKQVEESLAK